MERNENGLPRTSPGARAPMNMGNGSQGNENGCGGSGDCLDGMPLAYVYAPSQKFRMMYSPEDALSHGTLFEELYKPMEVYGNE